MHLVISRDTWHDDHSSLKTQKIAILENSIASVMLLEFDRKKHLDHHSSDLCACCELLYVFGGDDYTI